MVCYILFLLFDFIYRFQIIFNWMSNRPLSYPLESSLSSALKELRDILDKKSSTAWTEVGFNLLILS